MLGVQSFTPGFWRVLKRASVAWLLPWRRKRPPARFPGQVAQAAAAFCPVILVLSITFEVLKRVAPDSARTGQFWNQYLPIHVRYVFTKKRYSEKRGYSSEEVKAAWERCHAWGASRVCRLLQNMSGYYVKSAQIMASKTDFLPLQWTQEMTPIFFDNMHPRLWKHVQKVVFKFFCITCRKDALEPIHIYISVHILLQGLACYLPDTTLGLHLLKNGTSHDQLMSTIFCNIDCTCLASASIAQVHAATLSIVATSQLSDSYTNRRDIVVKAQHFDMQALMESDIRNLRRLCRLVRGDLPYDPTPLIDEMRDTVGKEFDFVREARLMRVIAERLSLDGLKIRIPQPVTELISPQLLVMERMPGIPFSRILQGSDMGLRHRAAAAVPELMECYGRMMFRDGLFHADPHAGNLLLQEDGSIALLDFGQCKALPVARHHALAELIVAMDDGDDVRIALAMSRFGMDFSALGGGLPNPAIIRIVAFIIFDTRPLKEARISPMAEDAIIKQIPLKKAPEDLFSLGRTVMLLRGLCFSLGLDIKAAKMWRPHAEAALRRTDLKEIAARNASLDVGEGF